ncbi:globin [Photobacterium kagoshimensis]|uniref:globin n=1 Tax=Photobacterium kagoshimensis TaxID=2910242 RepID=UPI003D122C01
MDIIQLFNDSYDRCNRNDEFLDIFYTKFFEKGKRFKQMFDGVDMEKQTTMMKASLLIIMLASTSASARANVKKYALRHGKDGLGISEDDLSIWFTCLLEAVAICDPKFDERIDEAWRHCFADGLQIMREECG